MKLTLLKIAGFRCFDEVGQAISLNDLTCFVGPNASGKTAALMALARVFGEHPNQRQIVTEDFHLKSNEQLKDKSERSLTIECRLDFPELADETTPPGDAVAETFNQMVVAAAGQSPFCRLRLDAVWTADGTSAGDIQQTLSWILTESDDPEVIEDGKRRRVQPADRARVRVIYIPAARDPDKQIKITTTSALGRLVKGLAWDGAEEDIKTQLQKLQTQLGALSGITTLNTEVQSSWKALYQGKIAKQVAFRALEEDPADLLLLLAAHFHPGEDGRTMMCSDLSDGLRSLFSLSLSLGIFRVEQSLKTTADSGGFKTDVVEDLPLLTIFAVEEPENHLSPHYLGRVVSELDNVARHPQAQVLLSSHSPAILGRVEPDDVRYFLGNEHVVSTRVLPLPLPTDESDEAYKYVREAVRGFPEIYFTRLVVFGEGPSEEIILKRLFEASGSPLDTHFVSIVPLGGRHVNHFWRLVHGLGIPHVTLLDLDREKEGAGWSRIQYVRDELVRHLGSDNPRLKYTSSDKREHSLADNSNDTLAQNDIKDDAGLNSWMRHLQENFHIFFSAPLDLDFAMLESFPKAYQGQAVRGPSLPKPTAPEYADALLDRIKQVLSGNPKSAPDDTGATYSKPQRELFPWYKYLFLDGSKPVAHMRAMIALPDEELLKGAPPFLLDLIKTVRKLVDPGGA
jgi:ABC-type cobalamin/Fe3+-siderophores transport system ATPase subunit